MYLVAGGDTGAAAGQAAQLTASPDKRCPQPGAVPLGPCVVITVCRAGTGRPGARGVQVIPEQVKGWLPETLVAPHGKHLNHSSRQDAVSGQGSRAEGSPLPGARTGFQAGVGSALERPAAAVDRLEHDGRSFEAGVLSKVPGEAQAWESRSSGLRLRKTVQVFFLPGKSATWTETVLLCSHPARVALLVLL